MGILNSGCQTETEAEAKDSVLEGRARAAMCCSSFLPSFQECQRVRGGSSMASQQTLGTGHCAWKVFFQNVLSSPLTGDA